MMKMFDDITKTELIDLVTSADIKIIRTTEDRDNDMFRSIGFRTSAIAGLTDYKDHKNDTAVEIIEALHKSIEDRQLQNGNYYSNDGKPFDTLLIILNVGSWSAVACWSDGSRPRF